MRIEGTAVAAPLVPADDADQYATHKEQYGQGGYRTVATLAERNAITLSRRKLGMCVRVLDASPDTAALPADYTLEGTTSNAGWTLSSASVNSLLGRLFFATDALANAALALYPNGTVVEVAASAAAPAPYTNKSYLYTKTGGVLVAVGPPEATRAAFQNRQATQSHLQRSSGAMFKRVYDRPAYGTAGNLVQNPAFGSGTTSWTMNNLVDGSANPLFSTVSHDGKTWLRLDQATAPAAGTRPYASQTINLPEELRHSMLEISVLVCGSFSSFSINAEHMEELYAFIDPTHAERMHLFWHPNGASSFTLRLDRYYSGQEAASLYVDFTEVAVREAEYTIQDVSEGLPSTGSNLQLARWISGTWDEDYQRNYLNGIARLGGMLNVELSAELLAQFITKPAPTKRSVSSSDLTAEYNALTTALKPNGLDPAKTDYSDWLFDTCRELGLKLNVRLAGFFGDGTGNPHPTLGKPGSVEFLDSDSDVQAAYTNLLVEIVERYRSYPNIVSWEIWAEGWTNWRGLSAGFNAAASYPKVRPASFSGWRVWERATFAAIKAADPNRPVVCNQGSLDSGFLFAVDDVCDWYCPSLYLGALRYSPISGSVLTSDYGTSPTFTNDMVLKTYAPAGVTLPSPLVNGTTYYVVNAADYQHGLATTPGGTALVLSGGSGQFWLYSEDGSSVPAFDYFVERASRFPKTRFAGEAGAATPPGLTPLPYRVDAINSPYLREIMALTKKYSVAPVCAWDEIGLLFDNTTFVLNASGETLASSSARSTQEQPTSLDVFTQDAARSGYEKLPGWVRMFSPGGPIPRETMFRDGVAFSVATGASMGSRYWGLYDPASVDKFRLAARMEAFGDGSWGSNSNDAKAKLSFSVQTAGSVDDLVNPGLELYSDRVQSNDQHWWPNADFTAPNRIRTTRVWCDGSGFIRTKVGDPTFDTDGRVGRSASAIAANSDYTVPSGLPLTTVIFDVPITNDRTALLPDGTTQRFNGDMVRIVRTANCTGAFNIVVAGKNLTTPGQSIDVVYRSDTGAWIVSGYCSSLP